LNDGTIDFSQELPVSDWDRLTFKITPPDWYKGVRFILRKEGGARAIVAELGAQISSSVCTAPPIMLLDRPSGAACKRADQCASADCVNGVCSPCASDSMCAEGELCGLTALNTIAVTRSCVEPGVGRFGTVCLDGRQCESGFCVNNACSECEDDSCEDGSNC